jgi:hypothetical protein
MSGRAATVASNNRSNTPRTSWQYLEPRPRGWKRQLFVKGIRLPASVVWTSMIVNQESTEQTAQNWDLPVEAVAEIVEYCRKNTALLDSEDREERRRAQALGICIEPPPAR